MKLGTMPYSIGLNRLIPFIDSPGLISTMSVFPKKKTADTVAEPEAEKDASKATSSPALRRTVQWLMVVGLDFSCSGTNSTILLTGSFCEPADAGRAEIGRAACRERV